MKRFCLGLIGGWILASTAQAAQYEISLPELKGVYSNSILSPSSSFSPFHPPASFHIDAIYLDITADITPARFRTRPTDGTPSSESDEYPVLNFLLAKRQERLGSEGPILWWTTFDSSALRSEPGAFQARSAFLSPPGRTLEWNNFQPGQDEVWFWLETKYISPEDSIECLNAATVTITDARLIVEGTAVPEPALALLALPGVLTLALRTRGQGRAALLGHSMPGL